MMNKEHIVTSFGTILEMLRDRGIDTGIVTKHHLADMLNSDQIKPIIEIIVDKTKVIYYTNTKFKPVEVVGIIQQDLSNQSNYDMYLLVLNENPTANNMKAFADVKVNIEIHLVKRLLFNITKHILVPKHEVIRKKSVIDDIISQYKLKNKYQLPIIMKNDPIAKYYGMKSGDVVKITRVSETAGEYIIYRCCL